jgi:adenylate cyclase
MLRREPAAVVELARAAIDVASKNGFPYWVAVGSILHGWASAMQGENGEGIAEIKRGLEGCRATGVEMDRPFYLALLAEAYIRGGQPHEAVSVLDEAFAMLRNPRTFFYEAELYRLRGNALREAGAGSLQDVDTCFQHSLEAARRYATLSLELRAAVSLARLWRDQGKHREARDLLIEVSARFTEGLSTADLVEAHAILQEMGAEQRGTRSAGL